MEISNREDVLNTRAMLDRVEELESENEDAEGVLKPGADWDDQDDFDECRKLRIILAEVDENSDGNVRSGITLIRESYFTEYIKDYWMEAGPEFKEYNPKTFRDEDVKREDLFSREPFNFIDWKAVAESTRNDDYKDVDFDGVTYLFM